MYCRFQLEEWFDVSTIRIYSWVHYALFKSHCTCVASHFVRRAINTCVWIVSRYNYQLARYRLRYFYCFLSVKICEYNKNEKLKSRKSVQRLISFIDRQGLIPLFVLLCFPFTPNTLINIIASLSHIKNKILFLY